MIENCEINSLRYEHKRDNLFKQDYREGLDQGEKVKGYHYSYFVQRKPSEPIITVPEYHSEDVREVYTVSINITKVFTLIKKKLSNKDGSTKKLMLDISLSESYIYGALLEYLRSEWLEGNRGNVFLTKKEFAMIMPSKK